MDKPIVYSCSGCSSAAQMANWLAVQLDRTGLFEMSCIAGVGGHVKPLVLKAKQASKIVGIDGCPLHCVKACLKGVEQTPDVHVDLSEWKVPKKLGIDFDLKQAQNILDELLKNSLKE